MKYSFFLFFVLSLFVCVQMGCIRLTGSAGYWKKDAGDETAEYKQVGFDTNRLVNQGN